MTDRSTGKARWLGHEFKACFTRADLCPLSGVIESSGCHFSSPICGRPASEHALRPAPPAEPSVEQDESVAEMVEKYLDRWVRLAKVIGGPRAEARGDLDALIAAVRRDATMDRKIVEHAWGVIANAGYGDWSKESKEWQLAAHRWGVESGYRLDFPKGHPERITND